MDSSTLSITPGFESRAHHLRFYQFIFELCHAEKTKINKKRPIFLKNVCIHNWSSQLNIFLILKGDVRHKKFSSSSSWWRWNEKSAVIECKNHRDLRISASSSSSSQCNLYERHKIHLFTSTRSWNRSFSFLQARAMPAAFSEQPTIVLKKLLISNNFRQLGIILKSLDKNSWSRIKWLWEGFFRSMSHCWCCHKCQKESAQLIE